MITIAEETKKQLQRLRIETLKDFAQEKALVLSERTKDAIIDKLAEKLTPDDNKSIEDLILNHRFAGTGPVHFYMFEFINADKQVCVKSDIGDPYKQRLHPDVSDSPQIIYAEDITPGKLFIETAHLGAPRSATQNWEEIEYTPTIITRVFIYKSRKIIQVHSQISSAKAIAVAIGKDLGFSIISPIIFSRNEIDNLKTALNAIAVGSDLKRDAGEIDMTRYRGRGRADLDKDPEYCAESNGKTIRKKLLQFEFDGEYYKIELAVNKPTIAFKTESNERVVEHVLSKIEQIKELPPVQQ